LVSTSQSLGLDKPWSRSGLGLIPSKSCSWYSLVQIRTWSQLFKVLLLVSIHPGRGQDLVSTLQSLALGLDTPWSRSGLGLNSSKSCSRYTLDWSGLDRPQQKVFNSGASGYCMYKRLGIFLWTQCYISRQLHVAMTHLVFSHTLVPWETWPHESSVALLTRHESDSKQSSWEYSPTAIWSGGFCRASTTNHREQKEYQKKRRKKKEASGDSRGCPTLNYEDVCGETSPLTRWDLITTVRQDALLCWNGGEGPVSRGWPFGPPSSVARNLHDVPPPNSQFYTASPSLLLNPQRRQTSLHTAPDLVCSVRFPSSLCRRCASTRAAEHGGRCQSRGIKDNLTNANECMWN